MNKFLRFASLMAFVAIFFACQKQSFLDPTTTTDLDETSVFADSARTMDFLANIYAGVDLSFNPIRFSDGNTLTGANVYDGSGTNAACDEAEGAQNTNKNTYLQFATGTVNPNTVDGSIYTNSYKNIRAVNKFLSHIGTAKFSAEQRQRAQGEARFLRAWYYSVLLKHYGGVPLVGDTVYAASDEINTKRNTYAECVDYIVSECDASKNLLRRVYDQLNYGRVTTGACEALKARVLLYAASPLFNESSPFRDNALLSYASYDKERWKKAADAADSVMRMGYTLYEQTDKPGIGFKRVFYTRVNNEFIFARMLQNDYELNRYWDPPSVANGNGAGTLKSTYPYQELVDAFDMKNGKPITDPASGFDPQNPYDNRDPRFNFSIAHNQSLRWHTGGFCGQGGVVSPIYTYRGASKDGIGVGTVTGYYINKIIRSDSTSAADALCTGVQNNRPLIRYAEVLLNFAEATNEYSGPTSAVYDALKRIRKRAGIDAGGDGNYGLKPAMTQADMRIAIQHERQVELAFEDHRFWDVRRWMIVNQTENRMMHGMDVRKVSSNSDTYTYQTISIRQHAFVNRNYFWPFPQSEVSKGGLVQNPGY